MADDLANRVINSLLTLARGDVAAIDALYQLGRPDDLVMLMCDKTVDSGVRVVIAFVLGGMAAMPASCPTWSVLPTRMSMVVFGQRHEGRRSRFDSDYQAGSCRK